VSESRRFRLPIDVQPLTLLHTCCSPYTVHFITPEGEKIDVKATEGDTMLDLAQRYDIDLECACEGSLACSTCHVILDQDYYDKMEEPTDEENDMLDLAFGLTDTYVVTYAH
jgi:ferredoxin